MLTIALHWPGTVSCVVHSITPNGLESEHTYVVVYVTQVIALDL